MADEKDLFTTITEEGRKLAEKVGEAIGSAVPQVEELGKKVVEGAKGAFEAAKPQVEEFGRKVMEGAKGAVDAARPAVEELGRKVTEEVGRFTAPAAAEKKEPDPLSREATEQEAEARMKAAKEAVNAEDAITAFFAKKAAPEEPAPEEVAEDDIPESTEK